MATPRHSNPQRTWLWVGGGAALLIAVVAVWSLTRRAPNPEGDTAQTIKLHVPADSPLAQQKLQASMIADLSGLAPGETGMKVVAAGQFEPSGFKIPQGLQVTWPLAERHEPGAQLWIVVLDSAKRWQGTGEVAVVGPTGRDATGKVYHFSVIGLSSAQPANLQRQPGVTQNQPPGGKEKDKKDTTPFAFRSLVTSAPQVTEVTEGKMEAAKKIYEAWAKSAGKGAIPWDVMRDIYRAADFETVKTLIEKGIISREHSVQMADLRVVKVLQILKAIGTENGWVIYRSDTGNQASGMGSDMDQTIIVFEVQKDGSLKRNESLDRKVVDMFSQRFESQERLTLKSVDIATIPASDNYPDPRLRTVQLEQEGRRAVEEHAAESMYALRKTRGAYTFIGPVLQQMQLRVLEVIESKLRKTGTVEAPPPDTLVLHPELQAMLGENFRRYQLNMFKLGPGADGKGMEWQEVFQEEAMERVFDGKPPHILKGHVYDCAVADYLFFMDHHHELNTAVKYHLRALDSHAVMRMAEGLPRQEYAKLTSDAEKQAYLERILGKDLAKPSLYGDSFLERWKTVFDISATIRNHHSAKTLNAETEAIAYQKLAEQLAGKENKAKWRDYLPEAKREYARRCQEFFMHNMIQTSTQRVMEWLSTDFDDPKERLALEKIIDETSLRKKFNLDGPEHDAAWKACRQELAKNYSDLARLQLLYSFRDVQGSRPDLVKEIVALAERRGVQGADLVKLKALASESHHWLFGHALFDAKVALKFPRSFYYFVVRPKFNEYVERIQDRIFDELGLVEVDGKRKPGKLVEQVGTRGVKQRFREFMTKYTWSPTKFLKSSVLNIGGLQAASTVLREFSESGGDPEVTHEALMRELVNLMPVVGPAKGIWEAQGASQTFLAVAPLVVPVAGIVMAVYTIGENGLVLYQHEYARPLTNELADAIYRGYVGPSLYVFSKEQPPPQFTEKDKEALEQAKVEVEQNKDKTGKGEKLQLQKSLMDQHLLAQKRAAWQMFQADDNRYRGSAILGTAEQLVQKPLDLPQADPQFPNEPLWAAGPLLARVKPMILYSRSADGDVDFTLPPFTEQQKQRKTELEKLLETERDPEVWVDRKMELVKLEQHEKAADRARRYLEAAGKNRELMHQIRLDSLWPYMLQDKSNDMVSSTRYVERWIAVRRTTLPGPLKELGITKSPISRDYLDVLTNLSVPSPPPVIAALAERLLEDTMRSRQLWEVRQESLKGREKLLEQEARQVKRGLMIELLSDNALNPAPQLSAAAQTLFQRAGITPQEGSRLQGMAHAIRLRNLPEAPAPQIRVAVRKIPDKDEQGKKAFVFRHDVKIKADPTIYKAPYHSKLYQLGPDDVQAAVSAKSFKGLPLSEDMVKNLQEHAKKNKAPKSEKEPIVPAVLVFVFCEEVKIPERVVTETTAHLPLLPLVTIPGEDKAAYLFGGAAPRIKDQVLAGALEIIVRRFDPIKRDSQAGGNAIELTSEALAKLDEKNPGLGVGLALYQSHSPDGPFERADLGFTANPFWVGPTKQGSLLVRPGSEGKAPTFEPTGWIAKNKFVFAANARSTLGDKAPNKPLYYQVGQFTWPIGKQPSKEEIEAKQELSNVAGPSGKAEIRVFGIHIRDNEPVKIGDSSEILTDSAKFPENVNPMYNWYGKLSLVDQQFDVQNAHFTVSVGGWTGHYWSMRVEGKRTFGRNTPQPLVGSGVFLGFAFADAAIPFNPRGFTLTVRADGGGYSAERSIRIMPRESEVAELNKAVKAAETDRDQRRKRLKEQEKTHLSIIDGIQKQIARVIKEEKGAIGIGHLIEGKADLASWLVRAEMHKAIEEPRVELEYQDRAGTAEHNWRSVLEARKKLVELALLEHKYETRRLDVETAGHVEVGRVPGLPASMKSRSDSGIKNAPMQKQELRKRHLYKLNELYKAAAEAAFNAGDGAALKEAALSQIKAIEEEGGDFRRAHLSNTYRDLARRLVTLTGNRTEATGYFLRGRELELEGRDAKSQADARKRWEIDNLPAWWPENSAEMKVSQAENR